MNSTYHNKVIEIKTLKRDKCNELNLRLIVSVIKNNCIEKINNELKCNFEKN